MATDELTHNVLHQVAWVRDGRCPSEPRGSEGGTPGKLEVNKGTDSECATQSLALTVKAVGPLLYQPTSIQ
jgi:hypothetical protein